MKLTSISYQDITSPLRRKEGRTKAYHDTAQSSFRMLGCYPENFRPAQFTRDVSDPHVDSHLCQRCRGIDFKAIFNLDYDSVPKVGKPVFELEDVEHSMILAECPLCRIFGKMIFEYDCSPRSADDEIWSWSRIPELREKRYRDVHFRAYQNGYFDLLDTEQDIPVGQREIVIGVVDGVVYGINHHLARHTMISLSTLRNTTPETTLGANITTYDVSLPLLERTVETAGRMLQHCLRNHEDCRHRSAFISSSRRWSSDCACLATTPATAANPPFPRGARIIHCTSRKIIDMKKGMRYLALSYVWGETNDPPATTSVDPAPQVLPVDLPQTIEDAITFTLKLGFQYVWIDRFCIDQCHSADKQHQISQMSTIYTTATATICALGRDDNAGIIGISSPIKYTSASSQGLRLVSLVHKVRHHMRRSVWSTRGWTLQEVMVSPRCFLFTEEGVTLVCRGGFSTERTVLKNTLRRTKADFDRIGMLFVTRNSPDADKPYAVERNPESTPFAVLRNEYQKRNLGYDEDAYNAFSAILSQLRTPSYWGLLNKGHPDGIIKNKARREDWNKYTMDGITIGFAHALSWYVVDPLTNVQRKSDKLPSWSWVSQTGRVEDWLVRENPVFLPEISIISIDEETCLAIGSSFWNSNCQSLIPCESKYLLIKSLIVEWSLRGEIQGRKPDKIMLQPNKIGKWTLSKDKDIFASNEPGIYFDNKGYDNGGSIPRRGKAILLAMSGDQHYQEVYWLAITQLDDGTYRRIGVIRTNSAHEDFGYYSYWRGGHEFKEFPEGTCFKPPPELVKTIWLG